jgi:hypothetical protein
MMRFSRHVRRPAAALYLGIAVFISGCFASTITPWEDGRIPYFLSGDFSETEVAVIDEAMSLWENACGVRFEEVTPRSYAYEIIKVDKTNAWASSIGENNVKNMMFFGTGGDLKGHVLHELGHCIGLVHEHQRPDRDEYVIILWENILPEYYFNFEKRNNPLIVESNYEYDYDSIMHYHAKGFSFNGLDTIRPLDGSEIGQREELSGNDIQKGYDIYGPPLSDEE